MPSQPTSSAIESQADAIARDLIPEEPAAGERSFDFISIITVIMTVIQTIVQACPKPPAEIRQSFRRPNLRQRAMVLKTTLEQCNACNLGRHANAIYQKLLVRAAALPDVDADAVIREASSDRNLLV